MAIMQAVEGRVDFILQQGIEEEVKRPKYSFFCVVWDAEIPAEYQSILKLGGLPAPVAKPSA